ncbi:MAG: TlpA disulfide reductase family protein [Pseudomonadota bacterium]
MNQKNLMAYGLIAIAFGAMGAAAGLYRKDSAPLTSSIAPTGGPAHTPVTELFAQAMNDSGGVRQALSQWKGQALVVNFWAPWCGPCVQEMPELDQLAVALAGKKIKVIGIGIDSPTNIREFAAKVKVSYPLYVAGMSGTELSRQFGNAAGGLPYTVLIGADGQVRKTYLGRLKFEQLKADIATL